MKIQFWALGWNHPKQYGLRQAQALCLKNGNDILVSMNCCVCKVETITIAEGQVFIHCRTISGIQIYQVWSNMVFYEWQKGRDLFRPELYLNAIVREGILTSVAVFDTEAQRDAETKKARDWEYSKQVDCAINYELPNGWSGDCIEVL